MRVAELERVGANAPGVGEEAIAAVHRGAIGQEIFRVQRDRVAGARARIDLGREREQLIVGPDRRSETSDTDC